MSDPVTRLNAALEGRYAIERELGEGGMAMVYLAEVLKHARKVALKVLKPELAAVVATLVITACSGGGGDCGLLSTCPDDQVTPPPVASVDVNPPSGTVHVGETLQLTATTTDASGNVLSGRSLSWSSSPSAVATVSNSGMVTGVSTGTATITATSENRSGTASVTVPPVTIVGTVNGTVTVEGTGLSGVTVNLVGAASQLATTGARGTYSFSNVPAGTYGVQISGGPADVIFATTSTVVTISTSGQTVTADFGGNYIRTSSIRGSITSGTGAGIAATVTASGTGFLAGESASGNSDTNGDFEFTGLRSGDYTVTISDFGTATFAVTSREVSVAVGQSANVNFVGTIDGVTTRATVTISSITVSGTAGTPLIATAVVGAINVNLTIDEGTETITSAAVLLDGVVVGTQTFSTSAPAEDGPGPAIRTATIQINTVACGPIPGMPCGSGNNTPTYQNGNHVVSAQITAMEGAGGTSTATADQSVNLTFANPDVIIGTLSASGGTGVNVGSQLWYGGNLTVNLLPVIYSGLTLGTVTVTYTDNNVNAPVVGATLTDASAPFAVTFGGGPILAHSSNPAAADVVAVTGAAYTSGAPFALESATINGFAAAPVLVDNVAPVVTGVFNLTDQVIPVAPATASTVACCSNNWINPSYMFTSGLTTTSDLDGGRTFTGVGGIEITFHIGSASSTAASVQATPSTATAGDAGIALSFLNTADQLWVGLTDALGNRSNTSLAGAGSNALTTVGLDDNPPTAAVAQFGAGTITDMTIIPAAAAGGAAHTRGFTLGGVEDRAGFSARPIRAWMTQDPASTNGAAAPYLIGASATTGGAVNIPFMAACGAGGAPGLLAAMNAAPCVPEFPGAPDAYYRMGGALTDQAGNLAGEIVRNWLIDQTVPTTSIVAIAPTLTGGAAATFSALLQDNVDLGTFQYSFNFAGVGADPGPPWIPFSAAAPAGDGARWDGVRQTSATAVQTLSFVVSIESVAGGAGTMVPTGAPVAASNVRMIGTDAAGNSVTSSNNFVAGVVVAGKPYNAAAPGGKAAGIFDWSIAAILGGALEAQISGPGGTFPNPFQGGTIYFYMVDGAANRVLLGTANANASTFTDNGTVRTFSWTYDLTATDVAAFGGGSRPVYAIGVDDVGAGLQTFNPAVTVLAASN